MKCIIIDDSRLARAELNHLLVSHPEVEVVAQAKDGFEAKTLIEQHQPDFLLLDIQMPGKTGFELLQELQFVPQVIFTTAYDEYAMKAFELNALDYLQKPIKPQRLAAALNKLAEALATKNNSRSSDLPKLSLDNQVFVKDGEKCWFVKLSDVRYFEVEGNYAKVFFENHRPMIPKTLSYLEERLDNRFFIRANRKQIVNLVWIENVEPSVSGLSVWLKDGTEIEVSRRQTQVLKEMMSL